MQKYLITPSLYNSYLWYTDTDFEAMYHDDEEKAAEAEKNAYQDFVNCLQKIKTPTTEAQQKGIDFENAVHEMTDNLDKVSLKDGILVFEDGIDFTTCKNIDKEEVKAAYTVAKMIGGSAIWQETLIKETDKYVLYGRSDAIKGDTIYDIKRTGSYEAGKFLKSIQHQVYFEGAESIDNFQYIVAAGKSTPAIFVEYYHKEKNNLENLLGKIDLMVDFINNIPEFAEPFNRLWITGEKQ